MLDTLLANAAAALAQARNQPADCGAIHRLATAVLIVMTFVGLVSLK